MKGFVPLFARPWGSVEVKGRLPEFGGGAGWWRVVCQWPKMQLVAEK